MISFKEDRFLWHLTKEPGAYYDLLSVIMTASAWLDKRAKDLIITSAARDLEEQLAVHPGFRRSCHTTKPLRAVDIRIRHMTLAQASMLCTYLNDFYEYDPSRPTMKVAILEDDHIHLQVHPNTIVRGTADEVLD